MGLRVASVALRDIKDSDSNIQAMMDGEKGQSKKGKKPAREERVKAALRANLQRRKQKARALKTDPDTKTNSRD